MSSGYDWAAIEAARKERIRQMMNDQVNALKEAAKIKVANNVGVTSSSNVVLTVFAEDNVESGMKASAVVQASALENPAGTSSCADKELDFSDLLIAKKRKPSKLEMELDRWVSRIDERPVITEKDETDRIRLIKELEGVLNDVDSDIEDRLKFVRMRVTSFLEASAVLTPAEKTRIEDMYCEYCALCDLLEVKPSTSVPYRVESEVIRMRDVLMKRRENEYIMDTIEEALEELGCHVREEAVLDHTVGQLFSVGDDGLCDVFVGHDGSGIMFEPVAASREGSLEQQRQIEEKASHVCSMYSKLEELALAKGVILSRVYADPANIQTMCVQSDISEKREAKKKRQAKARELKQRAIGSEG